LNLSKEFGLLFQLFCKSFGKYRLDWTLHYMGSLEGIRKEIVQFFYLCKNGDILSKLQL